MNIIKTKRKIILLLSVLLLASNFSFSQVTIVPNQTALALAQKLAGPGITISNATLTCETLANGTFSVTSSNLGLDSGIVLTTGLAQTTGTTNATTGANGPATQTPSKSWGAVGDAQLTSLVNTPTYDACSLEFDLLPQGDTLKFDYVFASEEYEHSVCYKYNDVFAFFISGAGITGTQNIALVPGTNIPVTVNSINNGIPGSASNGTTALCTAMGPGAPFTQYYVDNSFGTTVTYHGFTKVLTAIQAVQPCHTYHLKLAIADVSDGTYDSGVFIKAGSLHTNTFKFDTTAGTLVNGIPHCIVKGCTPAIVKVTASQTTSGAQTIKFIINGTAVNGVDYNQIADSIIILAGDTTASVGIQGIPTFATGNKTVVLYLLSPYSCGIVDSISINILDAPFVNILTHDTTICSGSSLPISVNSTTGLTYDWAPATGLNNTAIEDPIATPTVNTTYTLTATWPGTGCAPLASQININTVSINATILTPDTTVCSGDSAQIIVNGSDSLIYNWSPATGLNNNSVKNPVATPAVTTTYVLTVSNTTTTCPPLVTQVTINVANTNISILTPDTTICNGATVSLDVNGANGLNYSWSPATGLNNANIQNPAATPSATTTYILTASLNGLCATTKEVKINVFDINVNAGNNQSVCTNSILQLTASATPDTLNYIYTWSGPDGFSSTSSDPVINNISANGSGTYMVSAASNSCKATATVDINVTPAPDAPVVVSPISVCIGKPANPLSATGENLLWYNGVYDTTAVSTVPTPVTSNEGSFVYFVSQSVDNCISPKSEIDVQVVPCCDGSYFVPTAFTPNGDGKNDACKVVRSPNFIIVKFDIYDRWGQMVFEGNNSNDSWNGTFHGQPAALGTYYYSLIINCINTDRQETQNGAIMLIR